MEKALEKLARQLMAFDEASLTSMWEKYAAIVQNFEPTKRWEEAVVTFGLIQSIRWKNQLFNYHWKQSSSPEDLPDQMPIIGSKSPFEKRPEPESENGAAGGADKRGKLLRFRSREDDESV
ncbi:hypothetical protein [Desulfovibrio ferrophilus]|uniref:Uncharacterized protein n=1 Tax=Desulfovibrio ferrophilus TaxID=241368 RepID=A0A2Z6B1J0_9BACT|nr:hypothetical protein [Desulfovibrio ferrophilus]BBD09335.1 uncharacterized protein DFE_2609 [Desulfovibrio ferrophilus]